MNQATGKRPSLVQARMSYFPDWDQNRLSSAAQALEASGDIMNPTSAMLYVDLTSTGRRKAAARAAAASAPAGTTYNIGTVHNSPFQNVAAGGQGVQNTQYQMTANDLRAIVDLYRHHVEELDLDYQTRRRADAQVATIEAQLIDEPDPTIVRAAGKSLKTIVEGAIGGAVGNALANPGVWAPLLSLFG